MRKTIVILTAMLLSPGSAVAAPAPLVVAIDGGRVRGSAEDGVLSWKGMPFAAPPVGPLRWRAPQPPAKWSGVRDATAYGSDCMQKPFAADAAPLGTAPAEDCLYANVWRPANGARKKKLPVIFWIYGGGFINGGSSPPTYSGHNLAKQGVMFVSFNYRLGRFGAFAHPQLTRENPDRGLLGNYGYMDQLAALKWVHRNIARFGGDPANVTIIGESAGGMSAHVLLTSPMAKGLFHKAVVMSGGNGGGLGGDRTLADSEKFGVAFARANGIAPDDPAALAKLRALPAAIVVERRDTYSGPFGDGRLAVRVRAAYEAGAFARVPVMIGATSGDMGGRTGMMIAGARELAGILAGKGVPVYHYRFSYVAPAVGIRIAPHASDIPFFFDTQAIKYGARTVPADDTVGRTISAYLVNFARTGDPNGAVLPRWPRYDPARDEIMDFTLDGKAVAGKDPWGPLAAR